MGWNYRNLNLITFESLILCLLKVIFKYFDNITLKLKTDENSNVLFLNKIN